MKTWHRRSFIKILPVCVIFIAIARPAITLACDCLPVASANEAMKSSTNVFEGEVLKIQRFSLERLSPNYKEFAVRFRRIKNWKGKDDNFFIVRTPELKEHCGFEFEVGKSYVVYAVGEPISLVTRCSRTALSSSQSAQNDLRTFGVGR